MSEYAMMIKCRGMKFGVIRCESSLKGSSPKTVVFPRP